VWDTGRFVSSSVLVVVDRCVVAAADSTLRMEAFTLARENMEKILTSNSVSETVEYGVSDTNPNISWQTVIEAFSEPVEGNMWIRAVCSAEFKDAAGETQTVKLEHWLGELTQQQADQLSGQEDLEQLAVEQLIETPEEAAQYAGVSAETIEQWIEDGLLTADDGRFIKYNLDIYKRSQGNPSEQDKADQGIHRGSGPVVAICAGRRRRAFRRRAGRGRRRPAHGPALYY